MAESVQSPGVDISQVVNETPVVAQAPTLAPCVVGPCYEVMEAMIDGAVNADAKIEGLSYRQFPVVVPTSTFPTNNTTSEELVFQQGSVDALLARTFGGTSIIKDLEESALGTGFLSTLNIATRPSIVFNYTQILGLGGNAAAWPAVSAYFKSNKNLPTKISFSGGSTAQGVVDTFIAAGFDAGILTATGNESTRIDAADILIVVSLSDRSANYGASSSLSFMRYADLVASNDDYNKLAGIANSSKVDLRVEGSGIGVSSSDSSTIEVKSGASYSGDFRGVNGHIGTDTGWTDRDGAANGARTMYTALLTGEISADNLLIEQAYSTPTLLTSLGAQGAGPSNNGDLLYLDGNLQGQLMNVTDTSAKVVTVDAVGSRYDTDGGIIFQRYLPADLSGLSPRHGYIVATNLSSEGTAASVTVDTTGAAGYSAATKASITLHSSQLDDAADLPALQLQGTELHIRIDTNGVQGDVQVVPFEVNYDGAAGQAALKQQIEDNTSGIVATVSEGEVALEVTEAGAHLTLNVLSALSGSTANVLFQTAQGAFLAEGTSLTNTGADALIANFAGTEVEIQFDLNPASVKVTALDNTIAGLARQINDAVFSTVAVFDASNGSLTVTSGTKGTPSSIKMPANATLGLQADASSSGSGRPTPDLKVASNGSLHIGGQIFRSTLTGEPIAWNSLGTVDVHVTYKALRLDVSTSPVTGDAGLIKISSMSDLVNNFGPINDSNPLGLGLYYALINTGLDGTEVSAIGVNQVTPSAPEGTSSAYAEALSLISGHEVYAIAPLTADEAIISAFDQHVSSMSQAANRAERILISAPTTPTTEASTLVASGSSAESIRVLNTIKLDGSHIDPVNEHIDASANPIPESDGLFLDIEINGEARKYSIQRMSGANVVVRTNVQSAQFSSTPILSSDEFENSDYTIGLLGSSLNVPGTSTLDGTRFATTVRNSARAFANRRHIRIFPGSVTSTIEGINKVLPSYYYAAALAGDCASRPAQNPLTRNSLGGFTGVLSPSLTNAQLDIIAAGNLVLISESPGSVPIIRMQCTTDADALENRELSIVKSLDTFAKSLRSSLIGRVGRNNITQGYLDDLSVLIGSICDEAVRTGLLANANLNTLYQDPVQRDTLIVEVNVAVLYPANYIRLQIIV